MDFLTFFSRFLFSNKKDKNRKKIDVFSNYDSNPHGHKGIEIFNGLSCSEKSLNTPPLFLFAGFMFFILSDIKT